MFYENFKKLCEMNKTTPTAVLKELNISTSKGTAWKKGSEPNSKYIILISDYFNVPTDYLLGKETKISKQIINSTVSGTQIQSEISKELKLDEISAELLEQFKKLSFKDKAEIMIEINKRLKEE